MDLIGNVFKELLRQARDQSVKNANALADELIKDGMKIAQVEEMLQASGFENDIIDEALKDFRPENK